MEKFRIVPFRLDGGYTILWNTFPEDIVEKLNPVYFYNCRSIQEDGSVDMKTFLNIEPIKKFRKKETIIKFSDNIEIGLDD